MPPDDDRDALFLTWAPPASPWAAWAKPVLFAHRPRDDPPGPVTLHLSAVPASDGATAVVVDLPAATGVDAAVWLAGRGYRPVPLYNAVPPPPLTPSAVAVGPIVAAVRSAAADLRDARLPFDALPAFLLDHDRRTAQVAVLEGTFDNRSVSLPTDFPSAGRLVAGGIRRIILIQPTAGPPQADLGHTLRRWQDGGLPVLRCAADVPPHAVVPITVGRPSGFRSMWHALVATVGLRRHPLGGFGGTLPIPSAG